MSETSFTPGQLKLSGTSVTTAATLIAGGSGALANFQWRKLFSFPCEGISSILYVLPVAAGSAAPTNTQIANGGVAYVAADKVVQLELNNLSDIYACTDSGTFPVYETEWV